MDDKLHVSPPDDSIAMEHSGYGSGLEVKVGSLSIPTDSESETGFTSGSGSDSESETGFTTKMKKESGCANDNEMMRKFGRVEDRPKKKKPRRDPKSMGGMELEMKNEIPFDATAVERSLGVLDSLLDDVPNPTQEELRKILAIQGVFLTTLAKELLHDTAHRTKNERKIRLALSAFSRAESAISAAAKI